MSEKFLTGIEAVAAMREGKTVDAPGAWFKTNGVRIMRSMDYGKSWEPYVIDKITHVFLSDAAYCKLVSPEPSRLKRAIEQMWTQGRAVRPEITIEFAEAIIEEAVRRVKG